MTPREIVATLPAVPPRKAYHCPTCKTTQDTRDYTVCPECHKRAIRAARQSRPACCMGQ